MFIGGDVPYADTKPEANTDTYQAPEPVNTDLGYGSAAPSEATAKARASTANFGLAGVVNKTQEDYFNGIIGGDEDALRKEAATTLDYIKATQVKSSVENLIGSPGWHDAVQRIKIQDSITDAVRKGEIKFDPRSVFEDSYAHQYMNTLNWAKPAEASGFWLDAQKDIPNDLKETQGLGQEALSYSQYVYKKMQDAEDRRTKQGYYDWTLNKIPEMTQLYSEYKLRGNEGSFFGGGLGLETAKESQAMSLLGLPFNEFKDRVDEIGSNLSGNPDMELTFYNSLLGASQDDQRLGNIFSTFAIPDILGISKLTIGVVKGAVLRNQVNRAVKTALETALKADPNLHPDVVAPAAAGDLTQAAINQTAHNIEESAKGIQNTQVKQGIDSLMSGFKEQMAKAEADPGNFGQEGVNRLKEDTLRSMAAIQNGIANILKVERIPGFLASKRAVAAYREKLADLYPGFRNSILNIGDQMEWDSFTNTYHVPFYFGDNQGGTVRYFSNPQTAYNKAVFEGLVPSQEPRLMEVNKRFGLESSKFNQQIKDLTQEIREGPSMDADVHEMNRHAALPKQLAEVQGKLDDLMAWHGEELSKPGPTLIEKGTPGFTIEQQGNGYYIKITKTLDETDSIIRDGLLNTKEKWSPQGFFKDFVGWGRTPEETLSEMHNINRKIAAYGPSVFLKILQENGRYLNDLYKGVIRVDPVTGEKIGFIKSKLTSMTPWNFFKHYDMHETFSKILDEGRYLMDKNGENGNFWDSPGELERHYINKFGRSPSPLETAAYFAFRRQYEADKVFREIILYRNAARLGAEEHSISMVATDGGRIDSPKFTAIKMDHIPGGDDNIAVFGHEQGQVKIMRANDPSLGDLREKAKAGTMNVVRIFSADQRPLSGFGGLEDQKIHYVVTPRPVQTSPLQFGNMLPRRGGGHIVYDYDHYIKQAMVRPDKVGEQFQHWYEGDTTIMPISNRSMGQRIAAHLDTVRQHLKEANDAKTPEGRAIHIKAAKDYTRANLPIEWDELHSWFNPKKTPEGKIEQPRLGLEEPIQVVGKGQTIGGVDNRLANRYINPTTKTSTFRDATKGGSPGEQFRVKFSQERDSDLMYTINDTGTRQNPIYKYEPANMIDPAVTLNRSLKSIADSYFFDDYKNYAVEHWIQDAKPYLDAGVDKPESMIEKSPYYYFYHGKYKDADFATISALNLRHYHIQQLLGTPGIVHQFLHSVSQRLADAAYEDKFLQRTLLGNRISMAPAWMMQRITKPAELLLTATYHATIALWSLPQLIAQSMNYVTMGALAPMNVGQGSVGAILHQITRMSGRTPEILEAMDKIAVNMKLFKPGEWKEAYNIFENTGMGHVGTENMTMDKMYNPKVISTGTEDFLASGEIIFKGAERNARFGAWYIAYKEFRAENPTGRISNLDMGKILNRADQLTGNMSIASKSLLQTGIGRFPSQFLGYTMRLAEQFTGTKIGESSKERALTRLRMFGVFGAMFGFPQAMSLTGYPAGDYIRQWALDNGYVVGEKWHQDLAMNGIPSVLGALATGLGDTTRGTHLNIGQRFGSPGLDIINNAFRSDKATRDVLMGAPGQFMKNIIEHTSGLQQVAIHMIKGDDSKFKIKLDDLVEPLRIPSGFNYNIRSIYAVNTGKWLSRNESNLAEGPGQDITPFMSILMGLTGTQPQPVADENVMSAIHKDDLDAQKIARTRFIKEWGRYRQSIENEDPTQAEDYKNRAYEWIIRSDYPQDKRNQLLHDADQAYDHSMIDRLGDIVQRKSVPEEKRDIRSDMLERSREIQRKKRGIE